MKNFLKIKKSISLVLLFTISISLFSIYGCEDETVNPPSTTSQTTSVNGTINLKEIGGSNLSVQSIFKQNCDVTSGQFTTDVSKIGTQLLFITDGSQQVRGLTLSILTSGKPSPLTGDATSTAYSLMFLTPGITSTSQDTTSSRLNRISQLTSFQNLVTHLRINLPNISLNNLLTQSQTVDLIKTCVFEFVGLSFDKNISKNIKDSFDPDPYFQVNKSNNTINLKNYNFRYVNVYRRDIKADFSENHVSTIKSLMKGGTPYSLGCVFTFSCLSPAEESDNTYTVIDPDIYQADYWVVGPGFKASETPPSSISGNINNVMTATAIAYYIFPVIDLIMGAIGLNLPIPELMKKAAVLADVVKENVEVIAAITEVFNSQDLAGLLANLIDLSSTILQKILEPPSLLVAQSIVSQGTADYLTGFLPFINAVFGASNLIIGGWLLWNDTPKFSKYVILTRIPMLISPPNNSTNQSLTPTLSWTLVGLGTYRVNVSNNNLFSNLIIDENVQIANYTIPNVRLANNTKYYWRVNSTGNEGTSSWSSVWNFTTQAGGGSGGLVAFYPFNDSAKDESGNNNNGTNYGAIKTTDRFNNPNKAYSFNGTSNFIKVNQSSTLEFGTGDFTVCSWIQTTSSRGERVVSKGECFSTGWVLGHTNKILIQLQYRPSSVLIYPTSNNSNYNNGNWHFILLKRQSGTIYIYGDGVLDGNTVSFPYNLTNTSEYMTIGRTRESGGACDNAFHSGKIDDVRIYNRALSDNEIQTLYHEGGW